MQAYGLRTGFHNHWVEVAPLPLEAGGPATVFDLLFGATNQEVVMQIDIGHAMRGGADPVALLRKFPGRAKTVHLKEYSPTDETAVIGAGIMPWQDIFAACETVGGTEWYIVEHERYSLTPMECVDLCRQNLKKMGK